MSRGAAVANTGARDNVDWVVIAGGLLPSLLVEVQIWATRIAMNPDETRRDVLHDP